MRAHEVLTELFDRPYSYEWETKSSDYWKGFFRTDDNIVIDFYAENELDQPGVSRFDISFEAEGRIDITGYGDAIRILSTVVSMLGEFVNTAKPDVFSFASIDNSKSRTKLYRSMIKRFANEYGYEVDTSKDFDDNEFYELIKKGFVYDDDEFDILTP